MKDYSRPEEIEAKVRDYVRQLDNASAEDLIAKINDYRSQRPEKNAPLSILDKIDANEKFCACKAAAVILKDRYGEEYVRNIMGDKPTLLQKIYSFFKK